MVHVSGCVVIGEPRGQTARSLRFPCLEIMDQTYYGLSDTYMYMSTCTQTHLFTFHVFCFVIRRMCRPSVYRVVWNKYNKRILREYRNGLITTWKTNLHLYPVGRSSGERRRGEHFTVNHYYLLHRCSAYTNVALIAPLRAGTKFPAVYAIKEDRMRQVEDSPRYRPQRCKNVS